MKTTDLKAAMARRVARDVQGFKSDLLIDLDSMRNTGTGRYVWYTRRCGTQLLQITAEGCTSVFFNGFLDVAISCYEIECKYTPKHGHRGTIRKITPAQVQAIIREQAQRAERTAREKAKKESEAELAEFLQFTL